MAAGAQPRRAVAGRIAFLAQAGQRLVGLHACAGWHHPGQGRYPHQGQRCEVLHRVVRQLGIQRLRGGQRAIAHNAKAVLVRRAGYQISANIAAGTGPVVDHHGLAQNLRQRLGDHACLHVGRGTCGVADDKAQGFAGPVCICSIGAGPTGGQNGGSGKTRQGMQQVATVDGHEKQGRVVTGGHPNPDRSPPGCWPCPPCCSEGALIQRCMRLRTGQRRGPAHSQYDLCFVTGQRTVCLRGQNF